MAEKSKMPVKVSNFLCTLCTQKYKSQKFLDNHMESKHNPSGIVVVKEKKKKVTQKKEEVVEVINQSLGKSLANEMVNILTEVVDTVTTEKESAEEHVTETEIEVEKDAPNEVEAEVIEDVEKEAPTDDTEVDIVQNDQNVASKPNEIDTLSQIAENMAVIEQMVDGDDMFGSCDDCDYVSINDADLKGHMKQHQEETENCNICGLECDDKTMLDNHIEHDHSQKDVLKRKDDIIHKMSISLKKLAGEKKKLKQENNTNKKELEAARKEISIKSKRISILMVENSTKDEIKKVQTENIQEDAVFPCKHCNFKAKTNQQLAGHFKFEHLQCVKCKENFLTGEQLQTHIVKSHSDSVWNRKKNCDLCKRSFSNWTLYETHIKKHQCLRFTCTVCNTVFYTKADAVEHMETTHGETGEGKSYTCHMCEFNAQTEKEVDQHLDTVHLAGFETITNMENSIKDNSAENMYSCCLDCDFKAKTEAEVSQHLDKVHQLRDETSQPEIKQHETSKPKSSNVTCKNGLSCTYLMQNRCKFFHEVAAQPEEPWEEVRTKRQRQGSQTGHGGETWAQGRHGGFYRVHAVSVKWCKNGDKCHKGYRMSNGKLWNCPFRHQGLDFIQDSSARMR